MTKNTTASAPAGSLSMGELKAIDEAARSCFVTASTIRKAIAKGHLVLSHRQRAGRIETRVEGLNEWLAALPSEAP